MNIAKTRLQAAVKVREKCCVRILKYNPEFLLPRTSQKMTYFASTHYAAKLKIRYNVLQFSENASTSYKFRIKRTKLNFPMHVLVNDCLLTVTADDRDRAPRR